MVKGLTKYIFILLLWVTFMPLLSAQDTTKLKTAQDTTRLKDTKDTTKLKFSQNDTKQKTAQDSSKLKVAKDTSRVKKDTLFHKYCFQEQFDNLSKINFTPIDTALNSFQRYEPLTGCAFLGNSGKAYKSLSFELNFKPGFDLGENAFRAYMPAYDNVKYYNVNSPFSDLYYVMGSSKEQILKVIHTQNVNKRLNIALNFNIINSLGGFRRQNSDITNFVITTNYRSPHNRYVIFGNIISNKCYNYENGGLLNITEFTSQVLNRPDLFDVNLNNAQNRVKEKGIFFKQYLNFNKVSRDTLIPKDSMRYNTRLIHSFHYERTTLKYIDENPSYAFYPIINYEYAYTGDSIAVKMLSNEIMLSQVFTRNKKNKPVLYAEAGLEHQYIDHRQFATFFTDTLVQVNLQTTFINQYIPKINFYFNPTEKIAAKFGGYTIKSGYNNGDLGMNATIRFDLGKANFITLKASVENFQPAFNLSQYFSNHFTWDYNFDKTRNTELNASCSVEGYKMKVRINQFNNYVYYDFFARPKQYSNAIQIASASFSKLFKLGIFNLDNNILVQQSTNKKIIPMPLLVNNHSLYLSAYLFKKALYGQTGFDFYYNTSYYGYKYMPATRQFYLQTSTLTGNYPQLDFFVNMRIKRANIFFKLAHLNQGFSGFHYYSIPDYPLQGRAFKFGISWKFYD